jgi:SAM-dependent methyltransferase
MSNPTNNSPNENELANEAEEPREAFTYSSIELFDVMDLAVNYNRYLTHEILSFAGTSQRVLDFGAGTGRFSEQLKQRGYDVHAVEPDARLRDVLEEKGIRAYERLSELEEQSFDYVFTVNVLEHIEDDRAMLQQLYARLKPGGRLFVYVPAFQLLYSSNDALVKHFRRYSRAGLLELSRSVGFEAAQARYADSIGFFVALLYRIVGRSDGSIDKGAMRFYDRVLFPLSRVLDSLAFRLLGKNVVLTAMRPVSPPRPQ